jgi:hypothetical protein
VGRNGASDLQSSLREFRLLTGSANRFRFARANDRLELRERDRSGGPLRLTRAPPLLHCRVRPHPGPGPCAVTRSASGCSYLWHCCLFTESSSFRASQRRARATISCSGHRRNAARSPWREPSQEDFVRVSPWALAPLLRPSAGRPAPLCRFCLISTTACISAFPLCSASDTS